MQSYSNPSQEIVTFELTQSVSNLMEQQGNHYALPRLFRSKHFYARVLRAKARIGKRKAKRRGS